MKTLQDQPYVNEGNTWKTINSISDENYKLKTEYENSNIGFFELRLTPCRAEQPLRGMDLQQKETQKD